MTTEQKSSPSLTRFLGQFWRNFLDYLAIFLILISVVVILLLLTNDRHMDFDFVDNPVLIAAIPLVFFGCYCAGWAGAMLKCKVQNVVATGALGAFIVAALSLVVSFSIYLAAEEFPLDGAIIVPVVVFFASWLMITGSWFAQGLWGGPEYW